MREHDASAVVDAAIPVVLAVDRGVVLVVRPQRLQQHAPGGNVRILEAVGGEHRLARLGCELAGVSGRVRQVERPPLLDPLLVPLEAGDDARDVIADLRVVAFQCLPVGTRSVLAPREHALAQAREDRDLAQHVIRRRLETAPRSVHRTHRVLHRHALVARAAAIAIRASERRQDDRTAARDDMRAIEFRRHVRRETGLRHAGLDDRGVRGGADEVAADREEEPHLPGVHGADRGDGVVSVFPRRRERELLVESVEEVGRRLLVDAHRAVALHVGVPAHGTHSGAGAPDVALKQEHVDDIAQGGHGVLVLCEPHRPAHDRLRGCAHALRELADPLLVEARRDLDLAPGHLRGRLGVLGVTRRVRVDERRVEHAAMDGVLFDEVLADADEQRLVAAETDLYEVVGELRAAEDHAARGLRILEVQEAGFWQRVDRDDRRAALLRLLERGEHARVVRPRVLPGDDQQISVVDVGDRHGALADAERLSESGSARLVAHVRAVGQVVRAVATHEQLIEERRLV